MQITRARLWYWALMLLSSSWSPGYSEHIRCHERHLTFITTYTSSKQTQATLAVCLVTADDNFNLPTAVSLCGPIWVNMLPYHLWGLQWERHETRKLRVVWAKYKTRSDLWSIGSVHTDICWVLIETPGSILLSSILHVQTDRVSLPSIFLHHRGNCIIFVLHNWHIFISVGLLRTKVNLCQRNPG